MNKRLQSYLRSLGLSEEASSDDAWSFYSSLRGMQRTIANNLNYVEEDQQARTNCDLAIRSLGFDPANPSALLAAEPAGDGAANTATANRSEPAGGDGASLMGDLEAARLEAAAGERSRQDSIRGLAEVSGVSSDLLETAIREGHSIERAQQDFLRYHREHNRTDVAADGLGNQAPAGHARNSNTDFGRDSLLAAMMLREGTNDPTRSWPEYRSDIASVRLRDRGNDSEIERAVDRGQQLRGLSMVEIVRRCLEVDGIRCEPTAMSIGAAIQNARYQRGAVGTGTLTGVFTTSFAALMVATYGEAPDTTQGWTSEADVPNYFTNERVRMELGGSMAKRGRGQTAEMDDISDAVETYKVSEYAKQFVIDQQDLINDSFGALQQFSPRRLGAAAARLRPDLVYSILLANANMRDGVALFNASHANLNATSALAVATLAAARKTMRIQQENSVNLNLAPKFLIVPGALESTAESLVESNLIVSGSTTPQGELNPNARAGLSVVADARLDNGVIDPSSGTSYAGSGTTWFLASAGTGHTIEVGYIRELGRNPTVRTNVLTEGRFGISFDVQHSVGAKAIDWRGLVKATA